MHKSGIGPSCCHLHSLKSPQAIHSSSAPYCHHLQAQVCCPSAWTTCFACKASICSTTLWSSVPAKPPLLGDPSPLITDCSARAAHRCSQTYIRATGTAHNSICRVHIDMTICYGYICVYISICKKPFFDVVVLCSGNKKQSKKQERGIPLSSPSRVLECRVLPAGCCHRHSTLSLLCSHIRLRPA